eukprot:5113056-Amphidinium_carterae.1
MGLVVPGCSPAATAADSWRAAHAEPCKLSYAPGSTRRPSPSDSLYTGAHHHRRFRFRASGLLSGLSGVSLMDALMSSLGEGAACCAADTDASV